MAMAEFGQHLRLRHVYVRRIGAHTGKSYEALTLFDPGCTKTFIKEQLARKMGLTVKSAERTLNSVHGPRKELMATVSFEIRVPKNPQWDSTPFAWDTGAQACTRERMELSGPTVHWDRWARDHPPFQDIASQLRPVCYKDVDIFLGIDMEHLTEPKGPHRVSACGRYRAVLSALGWTISGPAVGMDAYHAFEIGRAHV